MEKTTPQRSTLALSPGALSASEHSPEHLTLEEKIGRLEEKLESDGRTERLVGRPSRGSCEWWRAARRLNTLRCSGGLTNRCL